jgi:hypothetical protein
MRMMRGMFAPLLFLVVCGCDSYSHPAAPADTPHQAPPDTPTKFVATKLTLQVVDTSLVYVGRRLELMAEARDSAGNLVDADLAEVTSSNSGVAQFVRQYAYTDILSGGKSVRMLDAEFALVGDGATTFRARLGNLTDEVNLSVKVMPSTTRALVVDSFYVVEQPVACAGSPCPYLVYWPVLRLREPTGTTYASAVGLEFTLPPLPARTDGAQHSITDTGLCRGALRLSPGASDYAYYVQDYLWANDFVMISLDGTPVPNGSAFARVIVQDSQGQLGSIEATGPILRGANTPTVPATNSTLGQWTC